MGERFCWRPQGSRYTDLMENREEAYQGRLTGSRSSSGEKGRKTEADKTIPYQIEDKGVEHEN
jgi:hypothetical protein